MASIPLPALTIRPAENNDPIAEYGKAVALKGLLQNQQYQEQERPLQLQERQQQLRTQNQTEQMNAIALQDAKTLQDIAPKHVIHNPDGTTGYDWNGFLNDAAGSGVSPQKLQEIQKSIIQTQSEAEKLTTEQRANHDAALTQGFSQLESVRSLPPEQQPQAYQSFLAAAKQGKLDVSHLPQQLTDPAQLDQVESLMGMHAQAIKEADIKADIAEKNARAASVKNPTEAALALAAAQNPGGPEDLALKRLDQSRLASRPVTNVNIKDQARSDKSFQYNDQQVTKLETPIQQLGQRVGRLVETLNQATPQADALAAPELLTVMAGGQGSGLRMNEAEISRIVGGRSHWQDLRAALQKWSTDPAHANSLTVDQRNQMKQLVTAVNAKLMAKQHVLSSAHDALLDPDASVEDHRKTVASSRDELEQIDNGNMPIYVNGKLAGHSSDGGKTMVPVQ